MHQLRDTILHWRSKDTSRESKSIKYLLNIERQEYLGRQAYANVLDSTHITWTGWRSASPFSWFIARNDCSTLSWALITTKSRWSRSLLTWVWYRAKHESPHVYSFWKCDDLQQARCTTSWYTRIYVRRGVTLKYLIDCSGRRAWLVGWLFWGLTSI